MLDSAILEQKKFMCKFDEKKNVDEIARMWSTKSKSSPMGQEIQQISGEVVPNHEEDVRQSNKLTTLEHI